MFLRSTRPRHTPRHCLVAALLVAGTTLLGLPSDPRLPLEHARARPADEAAAVVHLPAVLRRGAFPGVATAAPSASPTAPAAPSPTPMPATAGPPRPSPTPVGGGRSRYVAPDGRPDGDGSVDRPWDLQTALDHPAALRPGDTVWLAGGRYAATSVVDPSLGRLSYVCRTHGAAGAPIVFRGLPGERATLDGAEDQIVLFVGSCSHTWFWDLEVMSSAPVRGPSRAYVYVTAPGVKFINMVFHDLADGIDLWTAATEAELYGSILYHNGWDQPDGGHGHGIYSQNRGPGRKVIDNNILFSQYGMNVRIWSTNQHVDAFDLQHNIAFNAGALSQHASRKFNLFVVANNPGAPSRDVVARRNYTFAGRSTTSPACNAFGPNFGAVGLTLVDNVFTGQFRTTGPYEAATVRGNAFLGGTALPFLTGPGFDPADYPDNTYAQDVPTEGADAYLLPNRYDPDRAHLAVYNWGGAPTVRVDVGPMGLRPGERYELAQVMDLYEDVVEGVVAADGTIEVAMTGHTFAQAIGAATPPLDQFPHFGAFVVRRVR